MKLESINELKSENDFNNTKEYLHYLKEESSKIINVLDVNENIFNDHYFKLKLSEKKRKREDEDSANNANESANANSTPSTSQTTVQQQAQSSIKVKFNKSGSSKKSAISFDLNNTLEDTLPKPQFNRCLKPTPKHQNLVNDNFVDKKPNSQIQISSFYSSIEPYLRSLGEDDLMFLSSKGDDVTPYLRPPLGRHYLQVWDMEDNGVVYPSSDDESSNNNINNKNSNEIPFPDLTSQDMSEDKLTNESYSLGAVTQRALCGLVEIENEEEIVDVNNDTSNNDDIDNVKFIKSKVKNIEENIKHELMYLDLWEDAPSNNNSQVDDEISIQLSHLQNILKLQSCINGKRRLELFEKSRQRIAAQEYTQVLNEIEKSIEAGWSKRQKQLNRLKKKKLNKEDNHIGNSNVNVMSNLDESVKKAIDKRKLLIDSVGGLLTVENDKDPGKFFGLKEQSQLDHNSYDDSNNDDDDLNYDEEVTSNIQLR